MTSNIDNLKKANDLIAEHLSKMEKEISNCPPEANASLATAITKYADFCLRQANKSPDLSEELVPEEDALMHYKKLQLMQKEELEENLK